jgi:FlaA1/EpsC-like NDP-sugar epimerase
MGKHGSELLMAWIFPRTIRQKAKMIRSLAVGSKLPLVFLPLFQRVCRAAFPVWGFCAASFWEEISMNGFHIIVIGAGETGTPLLKQLLTAPFVKVLGVADQTLDRPGIVLAEKYSVPVYDDFMKLVRENSAADVIIDVTGVPCVRETLRKHMAETGNQHTLIMHERSALLMMSLSAKQLVYGKHDQLGYR